MKERTSGSQGSPRPRIAVIVAFVILSGFGAILAREERRGSGLAEPVAASFAPGGFRLPDTLAALITHGRLVYEGKAGGGLCVTCHGPQAKGLAGLGPDLTDGIWLHGDGSVDFIRTVIRTGVSKPRKSGVIMPPYGGSPLNPDQLEAVSTYIHSLGATPR